MKGFVKWFDDCPTWLKIIFALPVLDSFFWGIYRIVKGCATGKFSLIIAGVFWFVLGWAILWVIDIISIAISKNVKVLA